MLRQLILGSLRQDGVKHGYVVMKEIRDRAGLRVSIGKRERSFPTERLGVCMQRQRLPGPRTRRCHRQSLPGGDSPLTHSLWDGDSAPRDAGTWLSDVECFASRRASSPCWLTRSH